MLTGASEQPFQNTEFDLLVASLQQAHTKQVQALQQEISCLRARHFQQDPAEALIRLETPPWTPRSDGLVFQLAPPPEPQSPIYVSKGSNESPTPSIMADSVPMKPDDMPRQESLASSIVADPIQRMPDDDIQRKPVQRGGSQESVTDWILNRAASSVSGDRARRVTTNTMSSTNSQRSFLSDFATELFGTESRATAASTRSGITSSRTSVHFTIDDPDNTSMANRVFCIAMQALILVSVGVALVQSIEVWPVHMNMMVWRVLDLACSGCFFVEVTVRLAVYPSWGTFFSGFSSSQLFLIIDCFAALPYGLLAPADFSLGFEARSGQDTFGLARFMVLCVSPMLRLLKILRYMPHVNLLMHAFDLMCEALPSVLFVGVIIMWLFSSLIVLFEPAHNIESLPHSMWMVVVTMTTVGYGDVYPVTPGGFVVCSVLAVASLMFMALPIGIIGNIFTNVWEDRDRILLMKKTRHRLAQWGFTARDIPEMFAKFDAKGTGELDVFAFREMIEMMNIGFSEERIHDLFRQFDSDGSGAIDDKEFVQHLFPKFFHELYGHYPGDEDEDD